MPNNRADLAAAMEIRELFRREDQARQDAIMCLRVTAREFVKALSATLLDIPSKARWYLCNGAPYVTIGEVVAFDKLTTLLHAALEPSCEDTRRFCESGLSCTDFGGLTVVASDSYHWALALIRNEYADALNTYMRIFVSPEHLHLAQLSGVVREVIRSIRQRYAEKAGQRAVTDIRDGEEE